MKKLIKDNRAIGHFVGLALGVVASIVMYSIVFPPARTMMTNTVNAMSSMQTTWLNGTTSSASAAP